MRLYGGEEMEIGMGARIGIEDFKEPVQESLRGCRWLLEIYLAGPIQSCKPVLYLTSTQLSVSLSLRFCLQLVCLVQMCLCLSVSCQRNLNRAEVQKVID